MMTCTKTSRLREALPSVTGTVRVIQAVGTVGPAANRTGEIAVNGKPYFCRCNRHGYELVCLDGRTRQPRKYNLPADLSTCECMDFLSRHDKRTDGKCKHQKALGALSAAGKIPCLETDPVSHPDYDDENYSAASSDAA